MSKQADEAGADTIASRAAFMDGFMAEKVAGEVARDAMSKAGLPDDNDLYLNIGARLMLAFRGAER